MGKPDKNEIERRRFPRVMAPVFFRISKTQPEKQRIFNLSLGGVRIFGNEYLNNGRCLELEFVLPGGSIIGARARVVWSKAMPPGSAGLYDIGLEFIELSETAKKALNAVLKSNQT